jgi:hypothetical protein
MIVMVGSPILINSFCTAASKLRSFTKIKATTTTRQLGCFANSPSNRKKKRGPEAELGGLRGTAEARLAPIQ